MPKGTVLLPVHNAENYVGQAVESVLRQTFADFELLLLNDGSTDGSLAVLEKIAIRDKRCRIHSWSNVGLAETLNRGLALARGDFIIRMDADDICRPERFERQISFLESNAAYVAVGARALFIDPDGMPLFEAVDCLTHEQIEKALLGHNLAVVHP